MKKARSNALRREYSRNELGRGTRGKYAESFRKGTNLVLLSPDVAAAFPTDSSVNEALRGLIRVAEKTIGRRESRKAS